MLAPRGMNEERDVRVWRHKMNEDREPFERQHLTWGATRRVQDPVEI